jgi:putative NIF3 family GTP cyclohydrolase 1 type 2
LRDGITGVVYAVDCKINLVDKKYKIDGIQIHDYSFKTPKTLNGNETTAEVVGQFIKNNVNLIVSKAKTE